MPQCATVQVRGQLWGLLFSPSTVWHLGDPSKVLRLGSQWLHSATWPAPSVIRSIPYLIASAYICVGPFFGSFTSATSFISIFCFVCVRVMPICACVCATCLHMEARGELKCPLLCSLLYSPRQVLSLNPEFSIQLNWLARKTPGFSLPLPLQHWGYRCALLFPASKQTQKIWNQVLVLVWQVH